MRCSCYFADRAWKEPYIPILLPGKTLFVTLITSRQKTFIWGLSALSMVIRLPISCRLSCKPNDMERRDFFWCVHSTSVGLSVSFSGESILTDFPELAECGDRESRLNRSAAIGEHCICSEFSGGIFRCKSRPQKPHQFGGVTNFVCTFRTDTL